MVDDADGGAAFAAARRLHELALDYAARSHAAQAALVRAFESEASAWASEIGELVVNDADDEHLVLTSSGRFSGRVLFEDATYGWQSLDSPDDIAENYDPVDLFSDVADAVAEAFPGLDPDVAPSEAPEVAPVPPVAPAAAATPDDTSLTGAPTDSAPHRRAPRFES